MIYVLGNGGHSSSCIEVIEEDPSREFSNLTVEEFIQELPKLNSDKHSVLVALGDCEMRRKVSELISSKSNIRFETIISQNACVDSKVSIKSGTIVMPGAVIRRNVSVKDGAIINSNCTIEHDCSIGSFSHLGPGSVVCGNCIIESRVFLGANSTVLPKRIIGPNVTIGAGSVVTKDLMKKGIYIGAPAKVVSE